MSELNDKGLEELFSDRFKDFEVDVNPDLWNSVSQNIPNIGVNKGLSFLSKSIIGLSSVAVVTVASVIYLNSSDSKEIVSVNDSIETKTENTNEKVNSQPKTNVENNTPRLAQETSVADKQEQESIVTEEIVIDENEHTVEYIVDNNAEAETQVISNLEEVAQAEELQINSESTQQQDDIQTEDVAENNNVTELKKEEKAEINLTIPNIFTPNNDGDNDVYFIKSSGLKNFSFTVMNDQQKVVFQSEHLDFKWDGTQMNGQPAEAGNYFYILIAEDESGNLVKRANRITIRR